MAPLSILTTSTPYHLLSYGTLLGTEFFQSFVAGIVAFRSLPRAQFSTLQQGIFPVYFGMQTALPILLAITYPGEKTVLRRTDSSLAGVLAPENRYTVLAPLALIFSMGLANATIVGPATTRVMRQRKHQETRDGKRSYDSGPHSKEMQKLNKAFGRMHGASTLLNLAALVGTVWYGISLSERL